MAYVAPSVTDLGTLADLTLQGKLGRRADQFTAGTGGVITGDIVPDPS